MKVIIKVRMSKRKREYKIMGIKNKSKREKEY